MARTVLRKYHKKLKLGQMLARTRLLVDVTGVGWCGAGAGVRRGGGLRRACGDRLRTDRAKGLDDTIRSFAHTPAGPWLLVCVAAGLVLFGLFSFAMARWRRV
jgi:hypothetical protein